MSQRGTSCANLYAAAVQHDKLYNASHCKSKKCAFTLAEVLITLVIIGVVAALTIPNLLQKYQEEALKTAYKKTYNVLNNAYKTVIAETGPLDCHYKVNGQVSSDCNLLYTKLMTSALKIAKKCDNNALQNGCLPKNSYKDAKTLLLENGENEKAEKITNCHQVNKSYIENNIKVVVLNDGQILIYENWPLIVADINGKKGPNKWGHDLFEFDISEKGINGVTSAPASIPGIICIVVEQGGKTPEKMYNSVILNK